jgi:hypothetical protein
MPAAGGATPPQTPPAQPDPPTPPTPPATGDPDGLGDAGRRAIESERTARKEAEKAAKKATDELEALKLATLSDTEKAIAQAKKDGGAEVLTKVQAQIRRSETRAALTAANVNPALLDLAVKADEFATLTVDDDGEVTGLEAAVEAFTKSHPDAFKTAPVPPPNGSSDGGNRGSGKVTKEQVIAWSKDPVEYEKHRQDIQDWQSAQR